MSVADLFVGGVSMMLGVAGVLAAFANRDQHYRSTKMQWLERRGGRLLARSVYGSVGVSLFVLGVAIATGWCS